MHDEARRDDVRGALPLPAALLRTAPAKASAASSTPSAGILHDVGKLSVPHEILAKPGRLTDAEMDVIRRHPGWGEELLAGLGYPDRIRRWVRGQHERLDGSGYPDALGGPRLDLETRILAVADVYDALVSPRVYRGAWSREDALDLLREGAGTLYDERCVAELETLTVGAPRHLTLASSLEHPPALPAPRPA